MPATLALRDLSKEVFKIKAGLGYAERKEKREKHKRTHTRRLLAKNNGS